MNGELLVRTYDVGFGDCIFVRIPDGDDAFSMLIDCGTSNSTHLLRRALEDVRSLLPYAPAEVGAPQQKRLDLLVVTHPHEDHICGLIPDWFQGISIGQIWLSAFLKPDHPQAQASREAMVMADSMARTFLNSGLDWAVDEVTREVLAEGLCNADVIAALLGTASSSKPAFSAKIPRLYVSRKPEGSNGEAYLQDLAAHRLDVDEGVLSYRGFQEPTTSIRVLAPEWDIDGWYLGKESPRTMGMLNGVRSLCDRMQILRDNRDLAATTRRDLPSDWDDMLKAGLRFIKLYGDLRNDTSVVLLVEWRGRRLLFPGDAEWTGRPAQCGERNGSWDVMLQQAQQYLAQPLDFLKVAHHGSINGTPFVDIAGAAQPDLDKFLPSVPQEDRAFIVVSTKAGVKSAEHHEVPYPALMQELGRRARNARQYAGWQPLRTDLEFTAADTPFIDTMLSANQRTVRLPIT